MRWFPLTAGFIIGSFVTLLTIATVRLIVERKRKKRKYEYAIDVYEPEPLTPAKKH